MCVSLRFGVIHAVFTNLLLWCNGVMSEAEHFLNNHKRRLSSLGYVNLTIGKGTRGRVAACTQRKTIVHLRSSLHWMKDRGARGVGGEGGMD